ncbi:uncharacterized protein IL334_000085 [Kwoniella shivajii]|uniref:F-box domain-containing protein n=1 Tax=Kwoniella shivajii TaxID=564305 RepID=A0ABZ1CP99_9TREE|nr:hypothetical protein IL334_000085 [Kwoniella shivajii]
MSSNTNPFLVIPLDKSLTSSSSYVEHEDNEIITHGKPVLPYDITEQIFKHLDPIKRIRITKGDYDAIIYKLYEQLRLNKDTAKKILYGFIIANQPVDGFANLSETQRWKVGPRKIELLKLVSLLSFQDPKSLRIAGKEIDKYHVITQAGSSTTQAVSLTPMAPVFGGVKHLKIGKQLAVGLAEDFTRIKNDSPKKARRDGLVHFLELVAKDCTPKTVCLEWPSDWEPDVDWEDLDDEGNLQEPFAAYAMDDLVEALTDYNHENKMTEFRIHTSSSDIVDATSMMCELPIDLALIFDIEQKSNRTIADFVNDLVSLYQNLLPVHLINARIRLQRTPRLDIAVANAIVALEDESPDWKDHFVMSLDIVEQGEKLCPCGV